VQEDGTGSTRDQQNTDPRSLQERREAESEPDGQLAEELRAFGYLE